MTLWDIFLREVCVQYDFINRRCVKWKEVE
jgi:hypothetical protein